MFAGLDWIFKSELMKINVLISTIDEGIANVKNVVLSPRNYVSYIVAHQYTATHYKYTPRELQRPDVHVSHIEGSGVAKSRNHAILLADGDIGLFSDDDVTYRNSDIDLVKRTFLENSEVDVAVFKIRTPRGEPEYRTWPDEIVEYKKAPEVGTVQIAFDIHAIKEKNIWFDERFGAGQPLLICNDERLFLHDCIEAGLRVVYFPEYVVEHPYESTIKTISKYDIRKNWTTGGIDSRINGPVALIKALLGTIKILPDLLKHRVNPFTYFYQRISAVIYILSTNKAEKEKAEKRIIPTKEPF